jgi:hypothetical protein
MSDLVDLLSAMGVLGIFLAACILVAIPRKGDTDRTKFIRRLSRDCVTATLLCAICMALLALAFQ